MEPQFAVYNEGDSDSSRGYVSDFQGSPEEFDNCVYYTEEFKTENFLSSGARLEITEQPGDFRYRYEKEKYHGHIYGQSSPPQTKKKELYKFPSVQVHNYPSDVIVRCWLISMREGEGPRPHIHSLCRTVKGGDDREPIQLKATSRNSHHVVFDFMYIIHAVLNKKDCFVGYNEKRNWFNSQSFFPPTDAEDLDDEQLKNEIKTIDKNLSMLYFVAYDAATKERICEPVFSRKIRNLHNVITAPLKITDYSSTTGSCRGGERLFLFVEKISKDVEVWFFAQNGSDERTWEQKANVIKVHHQYGVIVETPKYRDTNINSNVNVFFELYRKNDDVRSVPRRFTYLPADVQELSHGIIRKRAAGASGPNDVVLSAISENPKRFNPNNELFHPTDGLLTPSDSNELSYEVSVYDQLFYEILDYSNIPMSQGPDGYIECSMQPNIPDFYDLLKTANVSTDSIATLPIQRGKPIKVESVEENNDKLDSKKWPVARLLEFAKQTEINMPTKFIGMVNILMRNRTQLFVADVELLGEFLERLSSAGLLDEGDSEGNSLLLTAASLHPLLVGAVLGGGADKEAANFNGDNALLNAARAGNIEVVQLLIVKHRFDPNCQNYKSGDTPLHVAIEENNLPLVKVLLENGADPLKDNIYEFSPYDLRTDNAELKCLLHDKAQERLKSRIAFNPCRKEEDADGVKEVILDIIPEKLNSLKVT